MSINDWQCLSRSLLQTANKIPPIYYSQRIKTRKSLSIILTLKHVNGKWGKKSSGALIELEFQTYISNKIIKIYGENINIMKKIKFSIPMHVI